MSDAPSRPEAQFAAASRASALALPMRAVASSTDVGWTSLLVEVRESDVTSPAYASLATPDQLLVLATRGEYEFEYGSAAHFGTAFARRFGRTPTSFRRDTRKR